MPCDIVLCPCYLPSRQNLLLTLPATQPHRWAVQSVSLVVYARRGQNNFELLVLKQRLEVGYRESHFLLTSTSLLVFGLDGRRLERHSSRQSIRLTTFPSGATKGFI